MEIKMDKKVELTFEEAVTRIDEIVFLQRM